MRVVIALVAVCLLLIGGAAILTALAASIRAIATGYGYVAMWAFVGVIAVVSLAIASVLDRTKPPPRQ